MKQRGFTLIELLIVVAIIAILAAIAVPNFLEAQTRAKVSRSQADLRSMATAFESYRIDWNVYPPSLEPAAWKDGLVNGPGVFGEGFGPNNLGVSSRLIPLTTPIAYITSVFPEVFQVQGLAAAGAIAGDDPAYYDTFDYIVAHEFLPGGFIMGGSDTRGSGVCSGGAWRLSSVGPDRIQAYGGRTSSEGAAPNSANALGPDYDPTNGTISSGDIIRIGSTAPGEEPYYDRVSGQINP